MNRMTNFNDLCMNCFEQRRGKNPCPKCGAPIQNPSRNGIVLPPGTILSGKHLIGRVLGQGGFGVTYLGFDLNLKSKVAIKEYFLNGFVTRKGGKVIPINRQYRETFREGVEIFYREAENLARFRSNPIIVNVYDFFRENGTAYIVMEYITGTALSAYLEKRNGRIGFDETLRILTPIMDALTTLHNSNLVHRDVSPENILLATDGRIRLIDFGAAMPTMKGNRDNLPTILKVSYAPIEQFTLTGKQGAWTDLYALSATFYRCLTGEMIPESTDRMIEDSLVSPAEKGVDLPEAANRALMKALAVHAEDRFRTVAEFREALNRSEAPVVSSQPHRSADRDETAAPVKPNKRSAKKKKSQGIKQRNRLIAKVFLLIGLYLAFVNGFNYAIGSHSGFALIPIITNSTDTTATRTEPAVLTNTETIKRIGTDPKPTMASVSSAQPKITGTLSDTTVPTDAEIVRTKTTAAFSPTETPVAKRIATDNAQLTAANTPTATLNPIPTRMTNRTRLIDKMTEVNILSGSTNFWIDEREVAVQQFVNYLVQNDFRGGNYVNAANDSPLNPISNVSRSDAAKYCDWVGGRLPTVKEWLIAANPNYAADSAGDFKPDINLNEINCGSQRVNTVDNRQFSAYANGVYDLYGNVWEWVNGVPDAELIKEINPDADLRFMTVGGSWKTNCDSLLDPANLIQPGEEREDVGFRCVRDK